MTTIIDKETDTDTMKLVEQCSVRGMSESFAVLDGIKDNSISLAKASEMSNAIGKATGAAGNLIKMNLLKLALARQAEAAQVKQLEAQSDQ